MTRLTVRLTVEAMQAVEDYRRATGATKTRIVSDAIMAAFGVKRGRPRKTASDTRAVKVGKGYRLLRLTETLRAGDEYWCWWTRRWFATSFEGEKPKGGAYRRPTKQGAGI